MAKEREFVVITDRMSRFGPTTIGPVFKTTAANPETVASNTIGNGRFDQALFHPISEGYWIYLEEDHLLLSILEPERLPAK